jgi:hypothetical protein
VKDRNTELKLRTENYNKIRHKKGQEQEGTKKLCRPNSLSSDEEILYFYISAVPYSVHKDHHWPLFRAR